MTRIVRPPRSEVGQLLWTFTLALIVLVACEWDQQQSCDDDTAQFHYESARRSAGTFFRNLEKFVDSMDFYYHETLSNRNDQMEVARKLDTWRRTARRGVSDVINHSAPYFVSEEFTSYMEDLSVETDDFVRISEEFLESIPYGSELRMSDALFEDSVVRTQNDNGVVASLLIFQYGLQAYREKCE